MDLQHLRASDGTGEAVLAHIQSVRTPGSTVLDLDNVDNWNTKCVVVTGTPNASGFINAAGMKVMYGHLNAGDFIIDGFAPGYVDNGNTTAEVAIVKMTTNWADTLVTLFGSEHKDNGKHKDVTADSVVLNSGQDLSNDDLYSNAIINGGCLIAQRPTAPTISSTYQYGLVDRFAAKATGTAVSAGTITQNTSSLVAATKGYEIKLAGVTLTGAGIVYLRYRMEAKEAMFFKNARASFGVRIHQNTGASVNATIYVNKANAADNFAATTAVANSGAIAVPNNTATDVKFENINAGSLGDVSSGLEIEIQVAVGAITTKDISFAELRLNLGAKVAPFQPKMYWRELAACQRYYLKCDTAPNVYTGIAPVFVGGGQSFAVVPTPVTMRATPTISTGNLTTRYGGADYGWSSISARGVTNNGIDVTGLTSTGNGNSGTLTSSTGTLRFDAEL